MAEVMRKSQQKQEVITWTVDDLWELPDDGNLYEVVDGELYMTPPPATKHQRIVLRLSSALDSYISKQDIGELFLSPCAVIMEKTSRAVLPDLFFVSRKKSHIISEKAVEGVLDLIIETSSPKTAKYDRTVKKKLYARHGVLEYWIVDTEKEFVQVFTIPSGEDYKQSRIYHKNQKLSSGLFPGFLLEVAEIFHSM